LPFGLAQPLCVLPRFLKQRLLFYAASQANTGYRCFRVGNVGPRQLYRGQRNI